MGRSTRYRLGGISALAVLVYVASLDAPFVYEDTQGITAARTPIAWSFPSRDLTTWTWHLQADPYLLNPARYHAVNLGLHLVNGALVALIGSAVISPAAGVGAAAVLLLHPLNSEAVSYVTARTDLLMTVWTLLAVWLALRVTTWGWLAVGTCVALAGLSKEIGLVALPLVLWTLLVYRREALVRDAKWVAGGWIALGVLGGALYPTLITWMQLSPNTGGTGMAWIEYARYQLTALTYLLWHLVDWRGLSIDHDIIALSNYWALIGGLLAIHGIALVALTWRRAPLIAWAIGWLALSVLPRFLFPTNEWLRESQLYLGIAGLSVPLGALLAWPWTVPVWRERTA